MRKWFLVVVVAVMPGIILLSGCTTGLTQEDLTRVQNEIEVLNEEVASLSAISAHHIWYDQYYSLGTYTFADSESFIEKFGALVEAIGDSDCKTAWDNYVATEQTLRDVVEMLPEDSTTWTEEQYNQWLEATTATYNALGEMGAPLFSAIGKQ